MSIVIAVRAHSVARMLRDGALAPPQRERISLNITILYTNKTVHAGPSRTSGA